MRVIVAAICLILTCNCLAAHPRGGGGSPPCHGNPGFAFRAGHRLHQAVRGLAWKTSALCGLGSQTFAGRNVQTGYEQGTGGFIAQSGFEETVQDVQPFRKGCPFSRHLVL